MTKVREDLLPLARTVAARFPGAAGELAQTQIESAIALQAREKCFSAEEEAQLIQLRSQLFKSPMKKLRY